MNTLVLDSSVAIKWAIPSALEPLTDESVRLLKRHIDSEIEFIVPDIFWAELGNVLWKGARQRRWLRAEAEVVMNEMKTRDFMTVSSLALLPEAMTIAFTCDRAVYDCLYVALAVQSKSDLITADERLANALAARFPVKWLGAF
ncbi:MAG: type II toxin-antitoxin system VapC family toxin [Candidatus Sulfotelmatobacter sp.]